MRKMLVLLIVPFAFSCSNGGSPDLGADLSAPQHDLSMKVVDLATRDLAIVDLAMTPVDLAVSIADLATSPDLSRPTCATAGCSAHALCDETPAGRRSASATTATSATAPPAPRARSAAAALRRPARARPRRTPCAAPAPRTAPPAPAQPSARAAAPASTSSAACARAATRTARRAPTTTNASLCERHVLRRQRDLHGVHDLRRRRLRGDGVHGDCRHALRDLRLQLHRVHRPRSMHRVRQRLLRRRRRLHRVPEPLHELHERDRVHRVRARANGGSVCAYVIGSGADGSGDGRRGRPTSTPTTAARRPTRTARTPTASPFRSRAHRAATRSP